MRKEAYGILYPQRGLRIHTESEDNASNLSPSKLRPYEKLDCLQNESSFSQWRSSHHTTRWQVEEYLDVHRKV